MVVRRKLRTPFFSMVAAPAIGTLVARWLAVFQHRRRRAMTPFRRLSNFLRRLPRHQDATQKNKNIRKNES